MDEVGGGGEGGRRIGHKARGDREPRREKRAEEGEHSRGQLK